jgi:hypothetical protein
MAEWHLTGNAGTHPHSNFLGTTDEEPLVIKINGTEVMRLVPGGEIGVGADAPAVHLHVKGGRIRLESADSARTLDLRADGAALDVQSAGGPLYVNGPGQPTFLNPNGGNVGVGTTSPRTPLHALGRISTGADFASAGAITFFPPDGFAWFHIDNGPAGGRPIGRLRISFGVSPGDHEIISILQNGLVGIGDAQPSARLTVKGLVPAAGGPPDAAGIIGQVTNLGIGIGGPSAGVRGINDEGHGVQGQSDRHVGIEGTSNSGTACFAQSDTGIGVWGVTNSGPFAGFFQGRVHVAGTLSKSGGGFRIDHPSEPAHKYLNHSFVESPERKNVYDGVTGLSDRGEATVRLPDWFEALNEDFRYQLTPIGAPAPQLHVASEIENAAFRIAGGAPGQRVCWQVTGSRKDPWARAHPLQPEEIKSEEEQGLYLHPELFNEGAERGTITARYPNTVRTK